MSAPLTLAERNDVFRQTMLFGKVVMTHGIAELPDQDRERLITAVRAFNDFSDENDPYGEHDFGAIEIDGLEKVFWKIDYYDRHDPTMGSEDPNDPSKTLRVLTIMFACEY